MSLVFEFVFFPTREESTLSFLYILHTEYNIITTESNHSGLYQQLVLYVGLQFQFFTL